MLMLGSLDAAPMITVRFLSLVALATVMLCAMNLMTAVKI